MKFTANESFFEGIISYSLSQTILDYPREILDYQEQSLSIPCSPEQFWSIMNSSCPEQLLVQPEQSWSILSNQSWSILFYPKQSWTVLVYPDKFWSIPCNAGLHREILGYPHLSWATTAYLKEGLDMGPALGSRLVFFVQLLSLTLLKTVQVYSHNNECTL